MNKDWPNAVWITIKASGEGPVAWTERIGRGFARAVSVAVAGATEGAKLELRKQLDTRGGRMNRLKGAIRSDVFPRAPRYSPNAVGSIYAAGDAADRMFTAFSTGPVITPTKGKALAIPLHNYRDVRGALLGPTSSFFAKRLEFIPQRNLRVGGSKVLGLFAMKAAGRPSQIRRQRNTPRRKALSSRIDGGLVPVFLLISAVKLPKLLSPEQVVAKWAARIPDLIAAATKELD